MAVAKKIGDDYLCPHCGVDLLNDQTALVTWESACFGRGWIERDTDTGEVYYGGKSSCDHEEIVAFYCSKCEKKVLLPDDIEEEWS